MAEIIEKDLSYQIVQAGYTVFNELGPGFDEEIYENAMVVVLARDNHTIEQQKRVKIYFQGIEVGLSYLKATGLELAMVINFGASRLQVARVVNTKNKRNFA